MQIKLLFGNVSFMDKLREFLNSLTTAEQDNFAIRCGTTIGYLRKAISEGTTFKSELVVNIERESNRAVLVEDLSPNVDWAFIRTAA